MTVAATLRLPDPCHRLGPREWLESQAPAFGARKTAILQDLALATGQAMIPKTIAVGSQPFWGWQTILGCLFLGCLAVGQLKLRRDRR